MCVQSETDEEMMPNDGIDDAMTIETVGGNSQLKKGPWTSAEDAILAAYVKEHGEGNWNAVQRNTGLARCGKSCRLRWSNHLRPDLKKGAFTPEEEHLIIELHHKMGNKWAQMAAKMPGRTDNEIKNYWNTRIKRQQRAGLPLYPPEISLQALDENQQTDNASSFSSMDAHSRDVVQVNNTFDIPEIQFKNLELDHHHVYAPPFLDIPLLPILHSPYPKTPPTPDPLQGSESIFSSATMSSDTTYQSGGYVQSDQPFMYSSAYDQSGSYAVLNGNSSAPSEPDWGPEEELPSLQTQAAYNWCSLPSSPLPSLDCNAVLHESQTTDHLTDSSDFLDMVFDSFSSELIHEAGWEPFGELTSSVGLSAPSLFNEGTVSEPAEAIPGSRAKEEEAIWAPPEYINKGDMTNQIFSQSGSRSI